ncbi:MAG: ATP-binding protein [Methanobacterium sp.]
MSKDEETHYFTFGDNFENKFAKEAVKNPDITLLELVSNSWDAGATEVNIQWPIIEGMVNGEIFTIRDNGHGMTKKEFVKYWSSLGIDKRKNIGNEIILDNGVKRKILGRNGKGRLGLFGFSSSYEVITCKDNKKVAFSVEKTKETGQYGKLIHNSTDDHYGANSGTYIKCPIHDNYLDLDVIETELSTRFGADPNFKVYLNDKEIKLLDLASFEKNKYDFHGNTIEIVQIPRERYNKKLSQYQIVWWVNQKSAETNKWRELGIQLDGTNKIENKFVFCIVVDFLENQVKSDWTGFEDTHEVNEVKKFVKEELVKITDDFIKESHAKRKIKAVKENKKVFRELTPISRAEIGGHIDKILEQCPSITNTQLAAITKILAELEVSKRGFELLDQLVALKDGQMDKLTEILDKWSINDAYYVLDELYNRLRLIKELETLVEDPNTLELKQLQPLFDRGLWIFGPEYEGTTNFTSNKTLNVVMRDLLKRDINKNDLENSKKRPDFVVLENDALEESTLGLFSSKAYDDDSGEVDGYRKILILELKRGGSTISYDEFNQANYYSMEIESSGKLQGSPNIITYVLGANVSPKLKKENKAGDRIKVRPRTYDTVINKAKARTLNLIENLKEVKGITDVEDIEIKEALFEDGQESLYT